MPDGHREQAHQHKGQGDGGCRLQRAFEITRQSTEQIGGRVPPEQHRAGHRIEWRELSHSAVSLSQEEPEIGRQPYREADAGCAGEAKGGGGAHASPYRFPQGKGDDAPARFAQGRSAADRCGTRNDGACHQPQQRTRGDEHREIVGERRCAEQCAPEKRGYHAPPLYGEQQQRHTQYRQQLRQGKAARDRTRVGEAVAAKREQHRQPGGKPGQPAYRRHHAQRGEAAQHRRKARREQPVAHRASPRRQQPKIQRRMNIARAQFVRDDGEAGMAGLQCPHIAGRERMRGPHRACRPRGDEQRVLLIVFGAAQPRGGGEHQRRNDQNGDNRAAARNYGFVHRILAAVRSIASSVTPTIGYRGKLP